MQRGSRFHIICFADPGWFTVMRPAVRRNLSSVVHVFVSLTSEKVTMSNGSSSMATTCATSLALMDAGVPVSAPVGGISGEVSPPRPPFLPDWFFSR